MLILVHMDRNLLSKFTDEWRPCEAFRLEERDDGTFEIWATTDLASTERAEREHAEAQRGIDEALDAARHAA